MAGLTALGIGCHTSPPGHIPICSSFSSLGTILLAPPTLCFVFQMFQGALVRTRVLGKRATLKLSVKQLKHETPTIRNWHNRTAQKRAGSWCSSHGFDKCSSISSE